MPRLAEVSPLTRNPLLAQVSFFTDAMDENGVFDPRYTCDFDNSSPELRWDGIPDGVSSFAVTIEDLDAPQGVFAHWLIYNIPGNLRHLPAGIPPQDQLPNGIAQGANGFGKLGYAGPCPPADESEHRYVLKLHLLSLSVSLPSRLTLEELTQQISPHLIGTIEITGRYRRLTQRAG